jgi:hypothetical protein
MPYNRKLRGEFPKVVEVSPEVRAQLMHKYGRILQRE